ncbi:hypothetical protein CRV01_06950 [Arcobacter sp. CECT 8983]|uniref:response regulator n=1 Tax=Arcobacter sp. CECT 8983 TaxID=2044508 RepID=UPI00100A910F|nr:response regulator [Arcobacter sp. CECT 8983]RXJ90877.1 hypothetical protein CRV01_06950 [Arcobacter sp. CECT 8983]
MNDKFKILILDDIEDNIYSLKFLIESNFDDIEILEATNVQQAILHIMKNDIGLILSDIQMPGVDGFEFVKYLSEIEATKDIPVMLITGIYNDIEHQKKAYASSSKVIDFISKPIDDEIFCSKLNIYLQLFVENKKHKKDLEEKDKLYEEQVKINGMIDELDLKYKDLMDLDDYLIDLQKLVDKDIQNNKK